MVSGQHRDSAGHTRLVVAGNQASKVKLTGPVEVPDDIALVAGRHMRHVRRIARYAPSLLLCGQLFRGRCRRMVRHIFMAKSGANACQ